MLRRSRSKQSIHIYLLAWLCAGLPASYLNAAQKQIWTTDTHWFVDLAVFGAAFQLPTFCVGADPIYRYKLVCWLCCVLTGLLATCLDAARKPIYTYLFVGVAVCGTACKLFKCYSKANLNYRSPLVCWFGCVCELLANCFNTILKPIWNIYTYWFVGLAFCGSAR